MKATISCIVLILALLLPIQGNAKAQDSGCDAELLADPESHEVALYLFAEIGKVEFERRDFVIAVIVYSNKLTIEEDTCGLGAQAKLLSWAFEVYRVKSNHHFKLITTEQYAEQLQGLAKQRETLYNMYCEAYPISCLNGYPIPYDELMEAIAPTPENGV